MSNIQTLIDTVQAEGLQTRDTLSTELTWMEYMNDNLIIIRDSIISIQERIVTYFDEEKERFEQAQNDLKAARRAETERLKESGARGFTTPAKTSDGKVAETPTDPDSGGGLLKGLGIVGLVTGLGVAVAGYFAGLTTALASGLAAVIKMITPKAFTAPFIDFFRKFKFFARALSDVFKGTRSTFAIKQFGAFSKTLTDFGTKLQKAIQPITNGITKLTTIAKNFFSPLGELTKLFPSGGSKFVEGFKAFGSKMGGIFKLFKKIAVPLTVIIATVRGILASFDEFGEDTSLLEKILITLKNVVKELISAFVTSLLELGKDIVSWVAGALGFTAIEQYLDSFDIDQKFREIFDGVISGIIEFFNYTKDQLYKAARAIGIVDMDPEAEARIAARDVSSAEEDLAEADTRVQQLEETISTSPAGSRERRDAQRQLKNARQQRDDRAEDLQEAEESAAERRTAAGLAPVPDAPPEADQLQEVTVPDAPPEADQLQEVTVPARETRDTTPPSTRPTLVASEDSANPVIETVPGQRVEPLSDLTNVVSINRATTAMQAAAGSVIPMDGALSPAGIMGAGLGSVIDGVKNLTSLPVAQASREVAAAKDKPQVVAVNGGSSSQNNTTVMNQQTLNMGAMSSRSHDVSLETLKSYSMA